MSENSDTIYVVKSNEETVYTVSSLYGLPVEELLLLNNLNYDSTLTVGQELIVKSESLLGTLLFGLEDYHDPICTGCNDNSSNCGNSDCECECNYDDEHSCGGQGTCPDCSGCNDDSTNCGNSDCECGCDYDGVNTCGSQGTCT